MTTNVKVLLVAGGAVAGSVAFIYHKVDKIAKMLNKSVADLSRDIHVDVDEAMVGAAVKYAVDSTVDRVVNNAARSAALEVSTDIRRQVRTKVEEAYKTIETDVSKEISIQVARTVDMDDLKRDVISEAKKAVIAKFDGKLDDLLNDFNANLQNISKIYSSIAGSISKTNESGKMVFTVGQQ